MKKSLEDHIKSVHRKLKDLVCQECSEASSIICWLTGPQYANLICYAFVWIAMLYHLLVCSFIPISGWPCYIIFWFANLYLCLVCKFIPISVIKYYTYFCYGYFCFFQIWFQTCYIYFWFAILYLRLLYPILVYSILLVMASSVISSSAPPNQGCAVSRYRFGRTRIEAIFWLPLPNRPDTLATCRDL